jgi:hypothetical protein
MYTLYTFFYIQKKLAERNSKLEAEMNRFQAELASIQVDIKEASELQEKNEHLDKYISEIPQLLEKYAHNIDIKKQMRGTLGISAYLQPSDNGELRHIDWALLTSNTASGVEPHARLCFDLGGKLHALEYY